MTINMLNLPSFKILDMKESEYDYRFLVETTLPSPSYCPKCGTVANLYKHGKKEQLFFDLPMHAKRVGIFVKNVMGMGAVQKVMSFDFLDALFVFVKIYKKIALSSKM